MLAYFRRASNGEQRRFEAFNWNAYLPLGRNFGIYAHSGYPSYGYNGMPSGRFYPNYGVYNGGRLYPYHPAPFYRTYGGYNNYYWHR